ncbi:MAG: NHL repeat-containing protein [Thermoguttaceae bacterium]|jgi:streptogramin lyase
MPSKSFNAAHLFIALAIVLAIVAGMVVFLRMDPQGGQWIDQPGEKIDPSLIHYRQTAEISVDLKQPHALAVGPDGKIFVAGDKAIQVLDSKGVKTAEIELEYEPRCLALGGTEHKYPGRIYVGASDHVEVLDADGKPVGSWDKINEKALPTSIAVAENDIFLADAGNRIVWHYDTDGKLINRIGAADRSRKIPGFFITSPYFDLAVGRDGLLYVANPCALRLEAYTFQGDLEFSWGKGSPAIDGFFGCCNPVHFAVLSEGRFVTAEKGLPRIKIYSPQGKFECVVAGQEQFPSVAADLAVDNHDRILVLDSNKNRILVFEPKTTAAEVHHE